MPTQVPASMVAPDVATQAELDAAVAVVQVAATQSGALATGTAIIPRDDTIPQITEGFEVLTQAFTPTRAANILEIEVVLHASCSVTSDVVAALFQDAGVNALAVASQYATTAQGVMCIVLRHRVAAASTAARTYRVRVGPITAGTVTINGTGGARYYGGVYASSITVREIRA